MIYRKEIEEAFHAFTAVKEVKNLDGKIAVLRKYDENSVLKNLLWQTYNTFRQYYIKQIPSVTSAEKPISVENYTAFRELLDN